MLSDEDIVHRTAHHPPRDAGVMTAHELIRAATADFLSAVRDNSPPSREQTLAITKAEEAMMWANAAIARTQKTGPDNA